MKIKISIFVLTLTTLLVVGCDNTLEKSSGIDISLLDPTVRPQDNFYNYVNGKWMETTKIPDDKIRWGSAYEVRKKTDEDVLALLKKASKTKLDESSDEAKAVMFFKLINDTVKRNKEGIDPLKPHLKKIDEISSLEGIQNYLIDTEPLGGGGILGFYVSSDAKDSNTNVPHMYPGPLGIERDYYLKDDDESKKIMEQYEAHVARMFDFLGLEKTTELAATVVAMETQMAAARMDKVESRDPAKRYNPKSIESLQLLISTINWDSYFNGIGAEGLDQDVIITDLGYFKSLDKLLKNNSLQDWKTYLKWSLVDRFASRLTTEMDKANWDFYYKTLRGAKTQEPLEKIALRIVNGSLGQPLGKLYVAEKFPPQAKEKMKELVSNLIEAYEARINNLEWMDATTKSKAIEKLKKTTVKVGYPDQWEDYQKLSLRDSEGGTTYLGAVLNISRFYFMKDLEDLKKPVDKTKWFMSPQTVNAYYNPTYNEIVFPAAILQPPFFDFKADAAINYGAIGGIIGHEISHGFDDSGADYDADGNLVNWWSDEDLTEFNNLGEKLADQYSTLEVLPGVFINGKFTLGENIGDLGGINASFDALKLHFKKHGKPDPIDGFSPEERFFLSWGTVWRTKTREQALKNQVRTDPHSPGIQRAMQPLKNMDAFYATFNVKEGDSMYLKPEERVLIW
ncbi:MAG: M13 family metallopeptidase [Flavobacteriaceae bacterium]